MEKADYLRNRYQTDSTFRAKRLESNRIWQRNNRPKINAMVRKYRTTRYREDSEYRAAVIAKAKQTYRELRDRLFAGYGNVCACCGESERCFLELDHINGGGAKHFHSHKSPVNLYREVIAAGFPPIYRLLCANCNRGRQRNEGICPHERR